MKQTAKIKMIKKDPCPYCDRALNFFNSKGVEVEIVDLTNNLDEVDAWKERTGWRTVPMIFIGDRFIGGYVDVKRLDEEGEFDKLVFAQ
ncbi:MAG: glutaredoxin [Pseudobdellovibrio sp.]|jgi:glutaredoxin 3|nr:glutaredoxin [Pseudobdellovibrio sp.]